MDKIKINKYRSLFARLHSYYIAERYTDYVCQNFEEETRSFINLVKQIKYEEREKDFALER